MSAWARARAERRVPMWKVVLFVDCRFVEGLEGRVVVLGCSVSVVVVAIEGG